MKNLLFSVLLCPYIVFSQDIDEKDSLKKYSYLLISCSFHPKNILDVPNLENIKVEEYATGFFIKINDKLNLITAYHVATKCDVYNGRQTDSKADLIVIRYYDTLNQICLYYISIANYKKLPIVWFYNRADLVMIELPDIPGAKLNTVENILFAPPQKEKFKLRAEKKFISYGFPGNEGVKYVNESHYVSSVQPSFYKGKLCDSAEINKGFLKLDTSHYYFIATPQQIAGTSGAPVFCYNKYKGREWIELAGVQSGASKYLNQAIIADIQTLKKELLKK